MDLIERQVQLPTGARPLGEYARYYADTGNGEITAVYLVPMDDQPRPGDTCARLDENFAAQVVPCEPIQSDYRIPAGQRRWVAPQAQPIMDDGGCLRVVVIFDTRRSSIKRTECNGEA